MPDRKSSEIEGEVVAGPPLRMSGAGSRRNKRVR